jgi:PAS domain S-box-containing protein
MSTPTLDVLIVDSDERVQARLETLVESLGRAALSVGSLMQARAALSAIIFPLIILDRALPDGDGRDLCREIRALSSATSRIMMLFASDSPQSIADGFQPDADEHVAKDCSDSEIVARINKLLVRSIAPSPTHGNTLPTAASPPAVSAAESAEAARLSSLRALDILDTPAEREYDDIVRLVAHLYRVPMAAIVFVDEHRVWFKAKVGVDVAEVTREHSISAYAIAQSQSVFCVNRVSGDQRFSSHPFVEGDLQVRSYAGAVLKCADGNAVGMLCMMDYQLREFSSMELETLASTAGRVIALLEIRLAKKASARALSERLKAQARLTYSTALFRHAFDNAPIGIALVSVNGDWLRINAALCEIVGYSETELLGMTFQAITHPDDLESDLHHVEQMLTGSIRTYEMKKRYIHKLGQIIWTQLSVSLVRNEEGQPVHFISYVQKITTERRRGGSGSQGA